MRAYQSQTPPYVAAANLRLILGPDFDAPEAIALRQALAWLFES